MKRNISARKKLSALYERGKELRFGPEGTAVGPFDAPPGEDDVAVWVSPVSPQQREMALRDAQAARARAMLRVRREEDSVEYLTAMAFLSEMDDETLIDYVIQQQQDTRRGEAERDVLSQEEWKDFDALADSWRHYAENPPDDPDSDPEYLALVEKDERFGDQISERVKQLIDADRDAYRMLGRDRMEKKALEKRGELLATQSFMKEYERQMMFFSVREVEDRNQLFFDTARELQEMPEEVTKAIGDTLAEFINDGSTAKNSQRAASGSTSADLPSAPETSVPSTLPTLSA